MTLLYRTGAPCEAIARRVLRLQLDQTTDQGSRRSETRRSRWEWLELQGLRIDGLSIVHPLCGPGLMAEELLARGCVRYHGVDISQAAVDHANELSWPEEFRFTCADVRLGLAIEDASFDLALLTYEAVNGFDPGELLSLLRNIRRLLPMDGRVTAEVRLGSVDCDHQPRRTVAWVQHSLVGDSGHCLRTDRECRIEDDVHVVFDNLRNDDDTDGAEQIVSKVWEYDLPHLVEIAGHAGFRIAEVLDPPNIETDHLDSGRDMFVVFEPEHTGRW